jgi:hypothetical protein
VQLVDVAGQAELADAGADREVADALERLALDGQTGALGGGVGAGAVRRGQDPGELLAADAGDVLAATRHRPEAAAQLGEHAIAGRMAVAVVDVLEVVDVEDHEAERHAVAPAARDLVAQALLEAAVVDQPRQRVVRRLPGQLGLVALAP